MLDQVVEVTTEAHQRDDLEIDVNDQNNEDGLQNGDGRDESDGHATESKKQQASAEVDFPKAVLKRIVKEKMREFFERNDMQTEMESSVDIQISKDALTAFNEAAKLFVYYITATANDICRESKRQTISPTDVITALQEVEFEELVEPVASLVEGMYHVCMLHVCPMFVYV